MGLSAPSSKVVPSTSHGSSPTCTPFVFQYRVKHKDGHWIWVQVRGAVVKQTAEGRARSVDGVLVDIDAQMRTEESLRATLAENPRFEGALQIALETTWRSHTVSARLATPGIATSRKRRVCSPPTAHQEHGDEHGRQSYDTQCASKLTRETA